MQDVSVWLQCFAAFVGVVAKSSPEAVPGLMAYMISIIRASQEYEGSAWAAYDAAFRRQVAATGQQDWAKINSSLYTICFTGKARWAQRCDSCLSAAHTTSECYALGEEEPDVAGRVRAVELAILAISAPPQRQGITDNRGPRAPEVCRLFNERRCNFRNCKYRHICRWCSGAHAGCERRNMHDPGPGPVRGGTSHCNGGGAAPPY